MKLQTPYNGEVSVPDGVRIFVTDIDPYEGGKLEHMEQHIQKLTCLVAEMLDAMPPEAIEQVAKRALHMFTVEERK